jgi:hypothetical protein
MEQTSLATHRREEGCGDAGELKELAAAHLGLTSSTSLPHFLSRTLLLSPRRPSA